MRTKFILINLMLLLFFSPRTKAQSITECEKIVQETVHAINSHSTASLQAYLSSDFECSGQKGNVATLVLHKIVGQLNEHVSRYEKISANNDEKGLTLVYKFSYSKLGERITTFVFNKENQIKRLDLFTVIVKKADKDIKIEKPQTKMMTIPIEVTAENLIVVPATINGKEGRFIIDSGAPSLYLNSKHFNKEHKEWKVVSASKDVNGSIGRQDIITVESFNFNGIQTGNIKVLMSDLSHLENGMEIHGLIGYSIYKDYDLLFDYQNKTLTLIDPDYTEIFLKENNCRICEIPFRKGTGLSHIPCINVQIDETDLLVGIDCGAGTNLLDFQLWEPLQKHLKDTKTTELKGAGNDKVAETHKGTLKSMKIGDKKFKNTNTVFGNISHLNTNRTEAMQGIIGYEILSRQKTMLCYKSQKLIFID